MKYATLLIALVLLAPSISGGSQEDPEITDPADDRTVQPEGQFDEMDVVAGWVTATEQDLFFHIETMATIAAGLVSEYSFTFHATGPAGTASAIGVALNGGGNEARGDATAVEVQGEVMILTVPRSLLDDGSGGSLTQMWIDAEGHSAGGGPSFTTDRAPDEGFGRDFPLTPGAPTISYRNASEDPFSLQANFTTAAHRIDVINWTTPADAALFAYVLNATAGQVNLTLYDGIGQQMFACDCNGTDAGDMVVEGSNGTWVIRLSYDGFAGSIALAIASHEKEPPGNGTAPPPSGNGNETGDGNDTVKEGKKSPLSPWSALVALAVVLARRRL